MPGSIKKQLDWPEKIMHYLGKSFLCPCCGRKHTLKIKKIVHSEGALNEISAFVIRFCGKVKKILLLADENTYRVAGARLEKTLPRFFTLSTLILEPEGEKYLTAREEYLPAVLKKAEGHSLLVTVGSGTITDLGKYAGHLLKIPVLSVPTAPSMNAYTSGVVALIQNNLKVAFPVRPVLAVFIDSCIVRDAPLPLIQAGFADSLARSSAQADWQLDCLFSRQPYCGLAETLVKKVEEKYLRCGKALVNRDPSTLDLVMQSLTLGGLSMLLVGSSAPASGAEHLVSHFWDMYSHLKKKEVFAYHGLQVGLGIILASRIYHRLARLSTREVSQRLKSFSPANEEKLKEVFSLFPSAQESISQQWEQKQKILSVCRSVLNQFWPEIKNKICHSLHPPEEIRSALSAAGCPVVPEQIGIPYKLATQAVSLSRYLRSRLTVLDVAAELGLLEELEQEGFWDRK